MDIYHSFDFKSAQKRIKKTSSGDYLVHLEDYENINDLIERSIRCKRKFVPETNPEASYDDIFDEGSLEKLQEKIDRLEQEKVDSEQSAGQTERSEGQTAEVSEENVSAPML